MESGYRCAPILAMAGGPAVIDGDRASGAVLMERFYPGTSLSAAYGQVDDLEIFCELATKISPLPTKEALPLEDYYLRIPEGLESFILEAVDPVFLHGDLHHENILLDGETWRPIDPKGLKGDPAFEAVAFLRNPIHLVPKMPDLFEFTVARLNRLSEKMGWSKRRMAGWLLIDRWFDVHDGSGSSDWADSLPVFWRVFEETSRG